MVLTSLRSTMNRQEFERFVLPIYARGIGWLARNEITKTPNVPDNLDNRERSIMNKPKSKFDEQWKLIRGRSTEWFSLMAEPDLKKVDKADDKLDKFVTILQVKYGYTRQQAREEINRRWVAFYRARSMAAG